MNKEKLLIWASLFMLMSCESLDSKESSENGQMVTRINFERNCPIIEKKWQSIEGAIALAVVPPLIETGLKGIGNAIKKAGEEKSFSTSSTDSVDFYSYNFDKQQMVLAGRNRCVVVFRARVGTGEISDSFKKNKAFIQGAKSRAHKLKKDYGIIDTPNFYYEAILQPSVDQTAFKISPLFIYYGKNIGKKKNVKDLVLSIVFGKPTATIEDKEFGLYTATFRGLKGSPLVVNSENLLEQYNSKFIPLPSASETAKSSLKLFIEQNAQLNSFRDQLKKLDRITDPRVEKLQEQIADIQAKISNSVKKARISLDRRVEDCKREEECDLTTDTEIIKLTRALKDASDSESLNRELLTAQIALKEIEFLLNRNDKRRSINNAIVELDSKTLISQMLLHQSTPVNVSVTLTESSNSNKFLVAVGEAIKGAAGNAKTKVTELLTPEDEDVKLSNEITELRELNELRKAAINSVDSWETLNTEYAAAPEIKKKELSTKLRIAYFKAKLDCNIVTKYGIVEPSCLILVEP